MLELEGISKVTRFYTNASHDTNWNHFAEVRETFSGKNRAQNPFFLFQTLIS